MIYQKIYSVLMVFVVVVAVSRAAYAEHDEVLSDEQAYSRAYTTCQQKISPFWMPGDGEPPQRKTVTQRLNEQRAIAKCMVAYNVPAAFDREAGVVLTGSGFGQNVHIKVEDMFPKSVLDPTMIGRSKPSVNIDLNAPIPQSEIDESQQRLEKNVNLILKDQEAKGIEIPDDVLTEYEEMKGAQPSKARVTPPPQDQNITAAPNEGEASKNKVKPIFLGR